MIVRPRENWFRMLLIWQGSVLPRIAGRLGFLLLFSILVYNMHGVLYKLKVPLNPAAFTLVGVALAIFLAFCNNAAYDRFWEGRKQWGALVIDTRSLARQVTAYVGVQQATYFLQLAVAYAYALNHQLRETDAAAEMDRLLPPELARTVNAKRFKPVWLLKEMAEWLQQRQADGSIDSITKMGIDQNLDKLSAIVGACERIHNTPIPFAYNVLLHRTVYIYCFMLPFGLVDTIGWMTPLLVTFIGYTFIALDAIVEEISEPFGKEPNDLALDSLCHTVETSLLEMVNKQPQPFAIPAAAKWVLN